LLHGNVVHGEAACAAVAGLVYEVIGAGEAVHCMVADYARIVAWL